MSARPSAMETRRGRFFGDRRTWPTPISYERGEPDTRRSDDRPIAALLTTLKIPARGEHTVVVVLGQADDRSRPRRVIAQVPGPGAAQASLEATRRWWLA